MRPNATRRNHQTDGPHVHSLLLVRNGVDHDARVLRAARVAERALGGGALVVGVATASAPVGEARVEGVQVLRLPVRPPGLGRVAGMLQQGTRVGHTREHDTRPQQSGETLRGLDNAPAQPRREATLPRHGVTRLTLVGRARRALSGLSFALQAHAVARRLKPRLVHANDWNTMWAGLFIKWSSGARLVYDSHELWADRNGRWEWRPWLLACEALFVRAADEVLTSSPGYADALAARYRIARPAVVRNIPEILSRPPAGAPNGSGGAPPDPNGSEHWGEPGGIGILATSRPRPDIPLVVYVGGLMPGRGLEQMIDALALIPGARLRAVGPGAPPYRAGLLARARASGVLDRVELRHPVAPAEVGGVLAEASAGLCLIQPICRSYELSLPNKLFEYAAAGVPVLASDLPVIGEVVHREGFGTLAPAADPHGIAASLERLLEPDRWRLAAERARAFAETHSWNGEANTLARLYRQAGLRSA
jgi:glycosyltransferase involved in cell wall biosynthesis